MQNGAEAAPQTLAANVDFARRGQRPGPLGNQRAPGESRAEADQDDFVAGLSTASTVAIGMEAVEVLP
jgi:hypothetical protein